jgi:hypothetical protein
LLLVILDCQMAQAFYPIWTGSSTFFCMNKVAAAVPKLVLSRGDLQSSQSKSVVPGYGSTRTSRALASVSLSRDIEPNTRRLIAPACCTTSSLLSINLFDAQGGDCGLEPTRASHSMTYIKRVPEAHRQPVWRVTAAFCDAVPGLSHPTASTLAVTAGI